MATKLEREKMVGKKVEIQPNEPPKTTIDLDKSLESAILNAASAVSLKTDVLESFSTMAQNREIEYELIDTMGMDSTVAAAIETYAEYIAQPNEKGEVFWVESKDAEVAKYVSYIIKKIDLDRNAYRWAYMLTKYGDVYIKLVRKSEFKNSIIFGDKSKDEKETLNEDVSIIVNTKNDHYADTLETVRNPSEMFELTKFGKTIGYIKAPVNVQRDFRSSNDINTFVTYKIKRHDVEIYAPTEFVHACLETSFTRAEEELDIFLNDSDYESDINPETFQVRRGTGILNNLFKIWRQLSLLENSVLLSRITRASITRIIQMEVGDMPQNQIMNVTSRVKALLEQKSALEVGNKMSEYVNPGPVENVVILPVKEGKGAINMVTMGGDYDPKTLTDLDWFNNKFFGGIKIPKAYFNWTDDGAGFNGGTSLSILSSRFARSVISMQRVLKETVTNIINLVLIDKGYSRMINNFTIKMQAPITQEEIDRKSDLSNTLRNVSDIMNTLTDVDDQVIKLTILKSLLANTLANQDITNNLQTYIDKLKKEQEEGADNKQERNDEEPVEDLDNDLPISSGMSDFNPIDRPTELGSEEENVLDELPLEPEEEPTEEDNNLPSGEELGVDLTQNMPIQ